jgi:hypothetical protein
MTLLDRKFSVLTETIQREILDFLDGRKDIVLWGAQAVNAYIDDPNEQRYTHGVDIQAMDAGAVADAIKMRLETAFSLTIKLVVGKRFVSLWDKQGKRKLMDINRTEVLPPFIVIDGVQVITKEELIKGKQQSAASPHRNKLKKQQDLIDLARLRGEKSI